MKRKERKDAKWAPAVQKFWDQIVADWKLSSEGLELLRVACEARQRMHEADVILARDGMTFKTRQGGIRAHPATRIRRDAESTFLQALRQVGLEV